MLVSSCRPDLGADDALVTAARVLAVRAEPAEAKPGMQATYTAFVAAPEDANSGGVPLWRWCAAPKPLAENDVVSAACLSPASLVAAGSGEVIRSATPTDACALFGPDPPPGGFRPRDPDGTGGYYQPLRVDLLGASPVFALVRVTCHLAGAPADVATAFDSAYVPNTNPHLLPLTATAGGATVDFGAIQVGAHVRLEASWPPADAESYVDFDSASQAITARRESMRVAWHVSAGALDAEATGRDEDDPATSTDVTWTAPVAAAVVHLWVVLRDSRGGVDFLEQDLRVTP
ncbi:MAG: hypothetical protein JOZ69_00910 [Myxococcales bacterium]|nr:hypothetical protein [Myxococcales bacterium]